MEKMDRRKKFMQGKRNVKIVLSNAIFDNFKQKLKNDGISQQKMLETAIDRYLKGIDKY